MKASMVVRLGFALLLLATGFAQSAAAPLLLTIAVAQTEITRGSEVRVDLTLRNNSNRTITLELTSPLCDYAVEVRDSTGNLAPDTEVKRESDCSSHAAGRDIVVQLRPHESHKDTIPLSMFSDMSKPGKYSVQVVWKSPKEFGGVVAKSNTITVTVIE
jgi:hypothetical protein